jgi:hypothetical protein
MMAKKRSIADQEVFDWMRTNEKQPGFPNDEHWDHAIRRAHGPFEEGETENGRILALLLNMSWVPLPAFVRSTLAASYDGWPGEYHLVPHLTFSVPGNFLEIRKARWKSHICMLKTMCTHRMDGDSVTDAAQKTAEEFGYRDGKSILNIWKNPEYFPEKQRLLNGPLKRRRMIQPSECPHCLANDGVLHEHGSIENTE